MSARFGPSNVRPLKRSAILDCGHAFVEREPEGRRLEWMQCRIVSRTRHRWMWMLTRLRDASYSHCRYVPRMGRFTMDTEASNMNTEISKWGNSLALRIPKAVASEINLSEGSEVSVTAVDGRLVITPVTDLRYKLEELLSAVSKSNVHKEVDLGRPVGKEQL